MAQINRSTEGGVQATSSFHSVSSIDSSAEMAKYFPDARTPDFQQFHQQESDDQRTQSTNQSYVNATGPYRPVAVAATATVAMPQVSVATQFQPAQAQPGHPGFPTEVEGLSISQTLVNDVIVDLQSKVINESQNQFFSEASTGTYLGKRK